MRFHAFPRDKERKKIWEQATRIKNFAATSNDVLCAQHFTPDSYVTGGVGERLREDAVPTIFFINETSIRPPPRKRPAPNNEAEKDEREEREVREESDKKTERECKKTTTRITYEGTVKASSGR